MRLEDVLRCLEGKGSKCILCKKRASDMTISADGVGICRKCYRKAMDKRVPDYYDTGGNIRRLFAPFLYEGEIRNAIFELKFGGSYAYAKVLAQLVCDALPPYYLYSGYDFIVPVPLHSKRLDERGYNQAELLAEAISERLAVSMREDILFRTRNTKHQMYLTRAMREKNVTGAFWAAEDVSGKRILLVDDIYTAGATARACVAALLEKGAEEVSVIAVCSNFHNDDKYAPRIAIPTVLK